MNAAKTALLAYVRAQAPDPTDRAAVQEAIADFIAARVNECEAHGDVARLEGAASAAVFKQRHFKGYWVGSADTWLNYVSQIHLALEKEGDPMHQNFAGGRPLKTERAAASTALVAELKALRPYVHPRADLLAILDMCVRAVETLDVGRDFLSVAVQVVTGARHVEAATSGRCWRTAPASPTTRSSRPSPSARRRRRLSPPR